MQKEKDVQELVKNMDIKRRDVLETAKVFAEIV
jgi:hypothetical protein